MPAAFLGCCSRSRDLPPTSTWKNTEETIPRINVNFNKRSRSSKYHSSDVLPSRCCHLHEILLPAITTTIRTKNNKVSNSLFLICSGFDCEVGSIRTLTSNNSIDTGNGAETTPAPLQQRSRTRRVPKFVFQKGAKVRL